MKIKVHWVDLLPASGIHIISEITETGLVVWQMGKRIMLTKCLLMFWKLREKSLWDRLTFLLIMWADSLGRKFRACKTSFSWYRSFQWIWTSIFIQWHINVVNTLGIYLEESNDVIQASLQPPGSILYMKGTTPFLSLGSNRLNKLELATFLPLYIILK